MFDHESTEKIGLGAANVNNDGKPQGKDKRCEWKKSAGAECDEWGWWEDRSLPEKIVIGIGFACLGVGLAFLFGWVVMLLWNWLMPEIFGLKRVTYWQAWGLLILSSLLFKNFGSGSGSGRSDRKRRRELRRYVREDQTAAAEAPEAQ